MLNDCLWLAHLALKGFSVKPTYVSVLSSDFTVAWYTIPLARHWLSRGHSVFLLQLQFFSSVYFLRSKFLLRESTIPFMLGIQLYHNFKVLRLKIGCNGWPLEKHSSTSFKNFLPRIVYSLWSKAGLNHGMFLLLDLFFLSFWVPGWNFSLC